MQLDYGSPGRIVQYLPPEEQARVLCELERLARCDQGFKECLDAAKTQVEEEDRDRDEWLVRTAREREWAEEDTPW